MNLGGLLPAVLPALPDIRSARWPLRIFWFILNLWLNFQMTNKYSNSLSSSLEDLIQVVLARWQLLCMWNRESWSCTNVFLGFPDNVYSLTCSAGNISSLLSDSAQDTSLIAFQFCIQRVFIKYAECNFSHPFPGERNTPTFTFYQNCNKYFEFFSSLQVKWYHVPHCLPPCLSSTLYM